MSLHASFDHLFHLKTGIQQLHFMHCVSVNIASQHRATTDDCTNAFCTEGAEILSNIYIDTKVWGLCALASFRWDAMNKFVKCGQGLYASKE